MSQCVKQISSLESAGTEEEGDPEKDPGKMEKREREKRRDSDGHPPPIPEKVRNLCPHLLRFAYRLFV